MVTATSRPNNIKCHNSPRVSLFTGRWQRLARLSITIVASFTIGPTATADRQRVSTSGSSEAFAITNVTVIDGSGQLAQPDMTVVVHAGRITFVGPSHGRPRYATERVVDGRGKFLLPGFIDTHAHVTYVDWVNDTSGGNTAVANDEVTRASLRLLLEFGITTVRNPGGPTLSAVAVRNRVAAGEVPGPDIFTAGDILNRAPRFDGLTRPVTNDADIQREIDAQAAARVDFIKTYGNLPPTLVDVAIRAAHAHGLKVLATSRPRVGPKLPDGDRRDLSRRIVGRQ